MMMQLSCDIFHAIPLRIHNCLIHSNDEGMVYPDQHCEDEDPRNNVFHDEELEYCRLIVCGV